MEDMERRVKDAEMKVKKIRKESTDQDGGVYHVPSEKSTGFWSRSGALSRTAPLLSLMTALILNQ